MIYIEMVKGGMKMLPFVMLAVYSCNILKEYHSKSPQNTESAVR